MLSRISCDRKAVLIRSEWDRTKLSVPKKNEWAINPNQPGRLGLNAMSYTIFGGHTKRARAARID